jgi:hypothetical protein
VPLFIACLFLLQTRYRPQMQEDVYYAQYLETHGKQLTVSDVSIDVSAVRRDMAAMNATTLDMISDIRTYVATVVTELEPARRSSADVASLGAELEETAQTLAVARQTARWDRYRIEVNWMLSNADLIQQGLASIGVDNVGEFGSQVPKIRLLTFGTNVAARDVQAIYCVVESQGIDHIRFANENMHLGRVYIGSYGYDTEPVAPLDDELRAVLRDESVSDAALQATVTRKSRLRVQ